MTPITLSPFRATSRLHTRAFAASGPTGETWPGFFEWQARGASFELMSLEATAGEHVAYAHALLRCDTPEGLVEKPENRLRLTLGLRKEHGRWTVAHEHHSFADDSDD